MKPWYQSKTMWFNIAAVLGGISGVVLNVAGLLQNGLTLQTAITTAVIGAANVYLRKITSQPIGDPNAPTSNPGAK